MLTNFAWNLIEVKLQNFISRFFPWKQLQKKLFNLFSRIFPWIQIEVKLQNHSVEKQEILSHWKKCRQINYLVISLVKPLLSRNFCKKSVRENFCNFHTVSVCKLITEILSHFFLLQNFRESNAFTKEITK